MKSEVQKIQHEPQIINFIDQLIDLADQQNLPVLERKILREEEIFFLEEEFQKDPKWNKEKQF